MQRTLIAIIPRIPPVYLDIAIRPGANPDQVQVMVQATAPLLAPPTVSLHQNGLAAPVPVAMAWDDPTLSYRGTGVLTPTLPLTGNAVVSATSTAGASVHYIVPFRITTVSAGTSSTLWSADGRAELYLPADALPAGARVSFQPVKLSSLALASVEGQAEPAPRLLALAGPYEILASGGAGLSRGANLSLFYSAASGLSLSSNPMSAGLYRWEDGVWVPLESEVGLAQRYASAPIDALGIYALFAEEALLAYLPLLTR